MDLTLACGPEGTKLSAHKLLLAAASPYFRHLLANTLQHTIVVLRDIPACYMRALLQFVYCGTVEVPRAELAEFLRAGSYLQITGLENCPKVGGEVVASGNGGEDVMSSDGLVGVKMERYSPVEASEAEDVVVEPDSDHILESLKNEPDEDTSSPPYSPFPPEPPELCLQRSVTLRPRQSHSESVTLRPRSPPATSPVTRPHQELLSQRIFGWQSSVRPGSEKGSAEQMLAKKPCVCTLCGTRFSYRNQLTEHKRTAHHE